MSLVLVQSADSVAFVLLHLAFVQHAPVHDDSEDVHEHAELKEEMNCRQQLNLLGNLWICSTF